MNGKGKVLGAAAVLGLLVSGFQAWGFISKVVDDMADRKIQQIRSTERLNALEARVCELEGGKWWQGDCQEKP